MPSTEAGAKSWHGTITNRPDHWHFSLDFLVCVHSLDQVIGSICGSLPTRDHSRIAGRTILPLVKIQLRKRDDKLGGNRAFPVIETVYGDAWRKFENELRALNWENQPVHTYFPPDIPCPADQKLCSKTSQKKKVDGERLVSWG
jgi:hypothetical protein